jgi:hypothetical protein
MGKKKEVKFVFSVVFSPKRVKVGYFGDLMGGKFAEGAKQKNL